MSTSDPFDLPIEVRGPVSQVSAGTNTSPLGTSPGPGALAGSGPGISPAAIAPIAAPTLPDPSDPAAMALLIARMANELFGGPAGSISSPASSPAGSPDAGSMVPVPSPQQAMTGTGASVPASPGLSPDVSPMAMPGSTSGAQLGAAPAAPMTLSLLDPAAGSQTGVAPYPAGASQSAVESRTLGAPQSGAMPYAQVAPQSATEPRTLSASQTGAVPLIPGASRSAAEPRTQSGVAPYPQSATETRMLTGGVPPPSAASQAAAAPAGLDVPRAPTAAQTSSVVPTPAVPTAFSLLDPAPSSILEAGANPFGATSLEGFDPGGLVELVRLPLSGEAMPAGAPEALRLETVPRIELVSHELAQPAVRDLGGAAFDPYAVRRDFPILEERVHGKRLVWLDNAATTQKPRAVIDRLGFFYEHENSNIHRAAHTLAARATDAYETGREITRRFLNAPSPEDIVFVRGATEGINLVAQSWGRRNLQSGDEIVLTHLEHHANIVPWQQLCAEKGARLRIAPVDDRGDLILEEYDRLLGPRTRLVAFPQVSNALGTITPAREMVEMAHRHGATVLVDGAQAVSHMRVDVQALDCDFYVFSGHKVFAPTGIGVVFGKRDVLAQMPPWQGGGNMIQDVTFERTSYQPPPMRFEAGTGNIADAAGLGAALEYVMQIGMDVIDRYEHDLLAYATDLLRTIPGLAMIGTSPNKAGVLSFVLDGYRNEDVGAALDQEGIAVRAGHHCAQPILRRFGLEGTVRASLALYNVCEDIDAMIAVLRRLAGQR